MIQSYASLYLSINEFEESGLPGSIGAHQGHPRLQVDPKVQVLVDIGRGITVAETHILDHDDRWRDGTTIRETERDHLGNRYTNNSLSESDHL